MQRKRKLGKKEIPSECRRGHTVNSLLPVQRASRAKNLDFVLKKGVSVFNVPYAEIPLLFSFEEFIEFL